MPSKPLTIFIGVAVAIISSAAQSIGLTFQRKSHLLDQTQTPLLRKHPSSDDGDDSFDLPANTVTYKKNLWRLGIVLFLLSNILGSTIQITTLPLIILSPLQAIGLVFNAIFASMILKEPFNSLTLAGTVLVSFGALVIAVFGGKVSLQYGVGTDPSDALDIARLWELFARRQFVYWFAFSMLTVTVLLYWVYALHRQKRRLLYSHATGIELYSSRPRQNDNTSIERINFKQGLVYGMVSGILSAYSLLFAKNSVEIITNAIFVQHNFFHIIFNRQYLVTWIFALFFLTFAVSQLVAMNMGLKKISTSIYYPLIFCNYNLVNILNGLIFYDQLNELLFGKRQHGWWLLFAIFVGVLFVVSGVFALSWSRLDENQSDGCCDGGYDLYSIRMDPTKSVPVEESVVPMETPKATFQVHVTNLRNSFSSSLAKIRTEVIARHPLGRKSSARERRAASHITSHCPSNAPYDNVVYIGTGAMKKKGKGHRKQHSGELKKSSSHKTDIESVQSTPPLDVVPQFSTPIPSDDEYEEEHSQFVSFGSPIDSPVVIRDLSLENDEDLQSWAERRVSNGVRFSSGRPVLEGSEHLPRHHIVSPLSSVSPFRDRLPSEDDDDGSFGETIAKKWPFGCVNQSESSGGNNSPARGRRMLSFEQSELLSQLRS